MSEQDGVRGEWEKGGRDGRWGMEGERKTKRETEITKCHGNRNSRNLDLKREVSWFYWDCTLIDEHIITYSASIP